MLIRVFAFLLVVAILAVGQNTSCRAPLPAHIQSPGNLFSAEQEKWLGEAEAEWIESGVRVVEDPAINAYLERISQRLLTGVPTHGITIKLKLVEMTDVNAFTIADGRIYVSRKLVAYAHSEDEVAGVLAHEFGHALTGQMPNDMSRQLRDLLKTTSLGDRKDVFDKFHLLLENLRRSTTTLATYEKIETQEQTVADQMAVALLARAGYVPHSFADLWDRIAETRGKTGNAFTDFFGGTRPESKRLRLILQMANALPSECKSAVASASPEFQKWQAETIAFSFVAARNAALANHADAGVRELNPPLRSSITHVRFSPDGKYVLAQDDAGVFVLTRDPFAYIFRFDAPSAYPAMFAPDSRSITFFNRALRVEQWDIVAQKPIAVHELAKPRSCMQAVVSPDGRFFACAVWNDDWPQVDLELKEVSSGTLIARAKGLYQLRTRASVFRLLIGRETEGEDFPVLGVRFSPDGRYLLATGNSGHAWAFDLVNRTPVQTAGDLNSATVNKWAWLGADRVAVMNTSDLKNSRVVRFPTGEVLYRTSMMANEVEGATQGDYLLLSPLREYAVGVYDLRNAKFTAAHPRYGIDLWDRFLAADTLGGDVQLLDSATTPAHSTEAKLPVSPLSNIKAAYVTPDLQYLAISVGNSAGVWNLATGARMQHLLGFSGAYIDKETLFADFPKHDRMKDSKHMLGRVPLDGSPAQDVVTVDEEAGSVQQSGRLRVRRSHPAGKARPQTVEVDDAATNTKMWSRVYENAVPRIFSDGAHERIVFSFLASEQPAKDAIKADAGLQTQFAAIKNDKDFVYYFEVVDGLTGAHLAHMLMNTGRASIDVRLAIAAGDTLIVQDTDRRMLMYSLKDGRQIAHFFGTYMSYSSQAGLITMSTGESVLHFISGTTGADLLQKQFSAPLSLAAFSGDGTRLLVITNDQRYRFLHVGTGTTQAKATQQ